MKKLLPYLKNKYLLTSVFLTVWIIFFDRNDFISQFELRQERNQLQNDKDFFEKEITKTQEDIKDLRTNPENLEKFAREKYLMKKDNEEIFVIIEKDSLHKS